jgi:hypothetical protein
MATWHIGTCLAPVEDSFKLHRRVKESRRAELGHELYAPLVEVTAEHFQLRDVSADKAYHSRKNLKAVERLGGTPFVPFKNTLESTPDEDSTWAKMYY